MTTATDIRPETPDHIEEGPRGKNATNYDLVDKEVAEYVNETRIQIDDSTNRRLKRMIDKRILAVMIVTYFTQALDKGTMSFASIMGIIEDTNLASNQYSWFTTIIFLIILVVEYPTNFILQRLPIEKYLAANIILWGATLSFHAAAPNFVSLLVLRGLLGAFEAVCQPAFVLLSSTWYKKEEQAGRIVMWYMMNGCQQILGGLLAFAFSFVPKESPLKAWQALFMTYGVATVFWGVFVLFWIPDSPMRAKCWSEEDKKLMVERVRENRTGVQNRVFRKEQIVHALKDPQVYAFALIQFCTTLPSGGFGAYASIIIKSFGFTTWQTQLLQMPTGVVMICVMLTSVWADRKFKQTILIMMVGVLPTIAGTVALISVPFEPSKRVGLLIAYYAMYSFWVCSGLALSLVSRNVAGQTKKTAVIASNFVFWAMGNSIGPQCFRDKDKPRYFMALSIVLGCFILLEVVLIVLRTYYVWMNKRRDAMVASGEVVADVDFAHSFEDITDNQNPHFRYSY
ncbi:allantoate permease [Purpureocillium lilacinum]|uniref:Allantoate permease n=1 Tax=Purpureocillium lilacinum TaxID=33203 RepID=A0A179GE89_PURLI|nr:allantoate permease [Purpureocillium lilacinum]